MCRGEALLKESLPWVSMLVMGQVELSDNLPEEIWGAIENCEDDKLSEPCEVYCEQCLSLTINSVNSRRI